MNIKKLKQFVKYNNFLLSIYRLFGNLFIFCLKLFVKVDDKKILFMSFGGQRYDDSPKALYEKIKNDHFFKDYKLIWSFVSPNDFDANLNKVKTDTLKFYVTVLSSKYWIHNSSMERGLSIKRRNTIEINTWHGTPLKKMGQDIENYSGYSSKIHPKGISIYCAQSEYDQKIWTRLFNTSKKNIVISDLPRNDYLVHHSIKDVEEVKKKLKLPFDKKIILYAPTFREYDRDSSNSCFINPPVNFDKWKNIIGNDYILLFRAHYEVVKTLGIVENDFCKNVSNYPNLNELMIISDVLISDYSSIFFDYSILERPMLCFAYDFEQYNQQRGLYEEAFNDFPCKINKTENDVLNEITNLNYENSSAKTKEFKLKYAPNSGNATDTVISILKQSISQ